MRAKHEPQRQSTSHDGKAQAVRAKHEPGGQSTSRGGESRAATAKLKQQRQNLSQHELKRAKPKPGGQSIWAKYVGKEQGRSTSRTGIAQEKKLNIKLLHTRYVAVMIVFLLHRGTAKARALSIYFHTPSITGNWSSRTQYLFYTRLRCRRQQRLPS